MFIPLCDPVLRAVPPFDRRSSTPRTEPLGDERLSIARSAARGSTRATVPSPTSLRLIEEPGDMRDAREFIATSFDRKFGARIPTFMPRLFTLRDAEGTIHGAMGLRGGRDAFYLEQYLDAPIERIIGRYAGRDCRRDEVVEVGHLCGTFPGTVRTLIDAITRRLDRDGLGWVTFTGTPSLRNAFHRLGLVPIDVGAARAASVPATDRAAWGRYYEDGPRVFVGSVRLGSHLLDACPASGPTGPRA